jgi:hypothetical protein
MVQVPQTRSFAGGITEPIEGRKKADDFPPFRGKSGDRQSKQIKALSVRSGSKRRDLRLV